MYLRDVTLDHYNYAILFVLAMILKISMFHMYLVHHPHKILDPPLVLNYMDFVCVFVCVRTCTCEMKGSPFIAVVVPAVIATLAVQVKDATKILTQVFNSIRSHLSLSPLQDNVSFPGSLVWPDS